MSRIDWRVQLTVAAGMVAGVSMLLLGMEPRLMLVAFVVLAVGAIGWLAVDLGSSLARVVWHDSGRGIATGAQPDRRVQFLRARLSRTARRRPPTARSTDTAGAERDDEIAATLIGVIDSQLLGDHGIDRATEPERAAEILGPELARFVDDPAARRSMTRRRSLPATLTLIEQL